MISEKTRAGDTAAATADDAELARVLEAYLAELEAGHAPDPEARPLQSCYCCVCGSSGFRLRFDVCKRSLSLRLNALGKERLAPTHHVLHRRGF